MKTVDKILLVIFYTYLLIACVFLWYKMYQVKDIEVKEILKINEVVEKEYVFYKNNTYERFFSVKEEFLNELWKAWKSFQDKNEELKKSERLRSDYFDFYVKYKNNIRFLEYLKDNWILLQDFEKKYALGRLKNNEKILNSIEINKEIEAEVDNNLLWKKKIIYNKENKSIRVQHYNESKDQWFNKFFWTLTIENIENNYVYKTDFVQYSDNWIYWVMYAFDYNLSMNMFFIDIEFDKESKNITNIKNLNYNFFVQEEYLSNNCNLKLKYLHINKDNDKLSLYCRNSRNGTIIVKDLIDYIKKQ